MNLADVTPLVLTYDEASNLPRSLPCLAWAQTVVILDSYSKDTTKSIAQTFPNIQWHERLFDDHTTQWNYGIEQIKTPWVLALDADYVLPESFAQEIEGLPLEPEVDAYYASFRYCIQGNALRATLYPPRAVLFRRDRCQYIQDGHTQTLYIPGPTGQLQSVIHHDDRKSLSRWIRSQDQYAKLEAIKLTAADKQTLGLVDRLRQWIIPAPLLTFFYCLFYHRLILDRWAGLYYTWQRVLAEMLLSLRLLESKCLPPPPSETVSHDPSRH